MSNESVVRQWLLVLALMLWSASCAGRAGASALVGTWRMVDSTNTRVGKYRVEFQFFKDGTFTSSTTMLTSNLQEAAPSVQAEVGNYKVVDPAHLRMTGSASGQPLDAVVDFVVSGNQLKVAGASLTRAN